MHRLFASFVFAVVAVSSLAQELQPVNPINYFSPSGAYKMRMNPSHIWGNGPTTYTLSQCGKVLWSKELPYALTSGAVDDEGRFGGCGNSGDGKTFHVVIFSRDGLVKLNEQHRLAPSQFLHTSDDPKAINALLLGKRIIFRIDNPDNNKGTEFWWVYDLESAAKLSETEVEPLPKTYLKTLLVVPETNWILMVGWNQTSFRLSLLGQSGQTQWEYEDIGKDYAGKEDNLKLQNLFANPLRKVSKGTIEVFSPISGDIIRFVPDPGGRTALVESERKPETETTSPLVAQTKLVPVKTHDITISPRLSPIHSVLDFLIRNDVIAILRSGKKNVEFVTTDLAGKQKRIVKLPFGPRQEGSSELIAEGKPGSYVVVHSRGTGSAKAWVVSDKGGTVTPLKDFSGDGVSALAGTGKGEFVISYVKSVGYSSLKGISYHDASGKLIWKREVFGSSGLPEEFSSAEDVEFDSAGNILVLDNIADEVLVFDKVGKYLRSHGLGHGDEPAYNTSLSALPTGEFLLESNDSLRLYDKHWKLLKSFHPRGDRGKKVRYLNFAGTPTSEIWLNLGGELARIDRAGEITARLGGNVAAPSLNGVRDVGDVAVSYEGAIYVVDEESGVLHIQDPARCHLVGRPLKDDFSEYPVRFLQMQLCRNGDAVLNSFSRNFLRFDARGKRLGRFERRAEIESAVPAILPLSWYWHDNLLRDSKCRIVKKIERWPDGTWIESSRSVQSPDGRLLMIESNFLSLGQLKVAFFSQTGAPHSMFTIDLKSKYPLIASDGDIAYFVAGNTVHAFSRVGQALWVAKLPFEPRDIFWTKQGLAFVVDQQVYWFKVQNSIAAR